MYLFFNILVYVILGAIVYQDFTYRAIHVLLVGGLFVISCCVLWMNQNNLYPLAYNCLFIGVVLFFLWIYIAIKNKSTFNSIKENIGIGDVLFFFSIAPLFELHNYMLFFITGMIITLFFALFFKSLIKTKFIPLAGILSAYLIMLKIISEVFQFGLFYNAIILSTFGKR